eukprot:c15644_g1_i1 orf=307-813(-)
MEKVATTDLCDAHMEAIAAGEVRVLPPIFQAYGQQRQFMGPIATVKVFEDNVLVRQALEEAGQGRVLLVDGGGSLRTALLGGQLAVLAQQNGWCGVIVNGCVRDVDEINQCAIGVRALASHPLKSSKKGEGSKDVAVSIAGVRIAPGEWCYVDNDGIIVSNTRVGQRI